MAVKLRDWAAQQGVNVGYDEPTGRVTLAGPSGKSVNFLQGSPEAAGLGLAYSDGTHYLDPTGTRLSGELGLGAATSVPKPSAMPVTEPTSRQTYQTGVNDILTQLRSKASPSQDITSSPYYQSSLKAAQQGADTASRAALETMNQRGILNSTIAGDRVAQIQQQNMTQTIPALIEKAYKMQEGEFGNLLNMLNAYSGLEQQEYTRNRQAEQDRIAAEDRKITQEQKKIADAWTRVKNIGYVDNLASIALGIPVGTPSYEAQKAVQDRAQELQIAREDNAAAMARTQVSAARVGTGGYTPGQRADDLMKVWHITGKAPSGLEHLGVSPGTPYPGSKGATATDEVIYQASITQYTDIIRKKKATLNEVYRDVDESMQDGILPERVGELVKARLKERFGEAQPQEAAVSNEDDYSYLNLP